MLRPALLCAAALTLTATAHADVYKSVDADGQVRYSDVWTPGAILLKGLSLKNGQLAADDSKSAVTAPASDASRLASQKATVAQDVAAAQANQCQTLKDQYNKEIHARRIRKPGSTDDDRQYMTDDEADAERLKTKQAMDEVCGSD